jgi:hypothetical protein
MSNKNYAVLLVLAGMVCGILLVSLASSPAAARLPDDGRNATMNVSATAPPVSVPPMVAPSNIRVYPVGTGGKNESAYAYIVIDGKLWLLEGATGRQIRFLR